MIKKVTLLVMLILTLDIAYSQKDIGEFLNLGRMNATKMSEAYLNPYGEMLGVNLNAGWYTAASVHKIGGFDLTFSASYTRAPDASKTYDVGSIDLNGWSLVDPSENIAPTMSGKMNNDELPVLRLDNDIDNIFTVPNGTSSDIMISPMITAGVGLPFHTEIMGRYMPKLSYGDLGSVQLWGIGLKHSIKDYIPIIKRIPIVQMSLLGGYTRFTGGLSLPDNDVLSSGNLDIVSEAITTRLLIGANLPIIAFYSGLGYGKSKSNFVVNGSYRSDSEEVDGNIIGMLFETSGFDFNAGMRVRLGIIGLHADYSIGEYSVITAGIGINFR